MKAMVHLSWVRLLGKKTFLRDAHGVAVKKYGKRPVEEDPLERFDTAADER